MLIETGSNNTFRVGTRFPVATSLTPNGAPAQFSYVDSGVSLDVKLQRMESKLVLSTNLDLSTPQPGEKANGANPTIANVRAVVRTIVTPKKPALIAQIEDPATMRKLDVEVTLIPVE